MANPEHLEILKSGVEGWNKWRKKNGDIRPDLSGANLPGANLFGAILWEVDLSNANLYEANLSGAFLIFANLSGASMYDTDLSSAKLHGSLLHNADLYHAILSYADLSHANLLETNLSGANLFGTNLFGVNLHGTDLSDTIIGNTIFGHTDLSACKGLESVRVESPCTIDFHTLRTSKNIPKSFLLKIGLPELYIDYLPDFYHDDGLRLYSVFLSHSWENKVFASKLYEALIAKGVNVFFDEKKLKPGDSIFDSLSRGIELYDKTILVCSKDSLNSWWVDQELELVTEKERNLQKEIGEKVGLLIPIKIDDHIDTWAGGKRMAIKNRAIGDFRNWQDEVKFEKALTDLIHALHIDRPNVKPKSFLREKRK